MSNTITNFNNIKLAAEQGDLDSIYILEEYYEKGTYPLCKDAYIEECEYYEDFLECLLSALGNCNLISWPRIVYKLSKYEEYLFCDWKGIALNRYNILIATTSGNSIPFGILSDVLIHTFKFNLKQYKREVKKWKKAGADINYSSYKSKCTTCKIINGTSTYVEAKIKSIILKIISLIILYLSISISEDTYIISNQGFFLLALYIILIICAMTLNDDGFIFFLLITFSFGFLSLIINLGRLI